MTGFLRRLIQLPLDVVVAISCVVVFCATPVVVFLNWAFVICGAAFVAVIALGFEEFPPLVWGPCLVAAALVTLSILANWWEEMFRGSKVSQTALRRGNRPLEDRR